MSLLDTIRAGVRIANNLTKPLQTTVGYQRCITPNVEGGIGARQYAASVPIKAIVDYKQRSVKSGGDYAVSSTTILFLDVAKLMQVTNNSGVDDNDLIAPPLGPPTPILGIGGFVDAGTGKPVATEAYLG